MKWIRFHFLFPFSLFQTFLPAPKDKRKKKVPKGFDKLTETLAALDSKMRDAEAEDTERKRKAESLWSIFRIHHQKSRYIYEMFYRVNDSLSLFCFFSRRTHSSLSFSFVEKGDLS
jgi:hypothetical protein